MIDTHVHIIRPDLFAYPWIESIDALNRAFTIEDYCARARAAGIVKAVLMEVDVDRADQKAEASHFSRIAHGDNEMEIRFVASGRPELDGFQGYLDAIEDPFLAGIRRVFHVAPPETIRSSRLAENVRLLADRDLTFDLCIRPDQIGDAIRLVDAAPDTRFVLDHCANPPVGTDKYDEWESGIAEIAERPNVYAKVSGLVNNLPDSNGSPSLLAPVLSHTTQSFGIDRMMFGGDWPVSILAGYELGDWVSLFRDLSGDRNEQAGDSVYSEVAELVYFSRDR